MRKLSSLALLPLALAASLGSAHCGDDLPPAPAAPAEDGGADSAPSGENRTGDYYQDEKDLPLVPASKVDLLFVIDNSASMGDKQLLLSTSVGRILRRLIQPSGDHAPVADLHLGVISTSLGTMGGDVCNAANPRTNDHAHLLNASKTGTVVAGAESGFLTFGAGGISDLAALEKAAGDIIGGVDQTGCGFEAQLESMYRFLSQPDPPLSVRVDADGKANYEGVDYALLAQRKAFLRPDSALAVVMITDEDDSTVDPRSFDGEGWRYADRSFADSLIVREGSAVQGTTAPRGTTACANPGSVQCQPCGRSCKDDDEICALAKDDANCKLSGDPGHQGPGYDGFYGPSDDNLNVRFHRMKQRYGVDPQFPLMRYSYGLTHRKVPSRDFEHPMNGPYQHAPSCTNPLFAAALPEKDGDELCALPEGTRSRELVFFGLIGGVPSQLLAPAPDWIRILGANPDTYDETGLDMHMLQSTSPRPGLAAPAPLLDNGTDPIHGREWDTNKTDLQYACTFTLPAARMCSANDTSCECASTETRNPPLCGPGNQQIRAKAYPTIRELRVAKALADRAIVGSICTLDLQAGYGPLLDALASRMALSLVK
jgi:hypothetical protein